MKKPIKTLLAVAVSLSLVSTAAASQYGLSLTGELTTASNGAVTTAPAASLNSDWQVDTKHITEYGDGVYRMAGWGIGNIIAVEGPEGWVIIDSGDNVEHATEQRAMLEAQLGHKITVKAVLYTHSHYVWGTKAWMDEGTQVYGHEDLVKNLLADNGVSVLNGNFMSRAVIQFGMLHPTEGQDAFPNKLGFGLDKLTGTKGFVPPHHTFKDGEVNFITVAGLEVEVLPCQTDVVDGVGFYFPAKKTLVSNALANDAIFNLYTLRGDIYRDPMRMVKAADYALARDIVNQIDIHGPAHIGKQAARENILAFRDTMQLLHDQTYRAIALGMDAQQAAEFVYLPQSLRSNRETYGQVESHVKSVYSGRIGWMGWDIYDINPLAKAEQAQKIIDAMGGRDAVIKLARAANGQQQVSGWQWSLYLTSQLLDANQQDSEAGQIRAVAARALGQRTTSANARGFYISEALLHEGKLSLAGHTLPNYQVLSQFLGALNPDKLAKSPLNDNVQYLRYMVDSRLAEGKHLEFNLNFTDADVSYAIALRNGVIAVTETPNAGPVFQLSKAEWDAMILGTTAFASLDSSLQAIDQVIGR